MNDLAEQYSKTVECATELTDFFLDQEGGTFALAVVCEILQVLLQAGELSAAILVIENVCRTSKIELPLDVNKDLTCCSFNTEQFAESLIEILETFFERRGKY